MLKFFFLLDRKSLLFWKRTGCSRSRNTHAPFPSGLLQGAEKAEESEEKVLRRVQVQAPSMKPTPTVALVTPSNHPSLFRRWGL